MIHAPNSSQAELILHKDQPSGYPGLDSSGKLLSSKLPSNVLSAISPKFATTVLSPNGSGLDDSTAMQAALNAGGTIILGPGTFLWNTQVPAIQPSTPTHILCSGVGETIVKLSSGAPRFLDFNKVADGNTFSYITISDLTVDVNNTGGQNHKFLGTYPAGGSVSNVNLDRITIECIEVINVPSPTGSTSPDHPLGIFLVPFVATQKGTGTQYTVTNITVRDYRQTGGHMAVTIACSQAAGYSGDGTVNVFLDNIHLADCWHDTGALSTVATGDNYQIGSRGFGDRVIVERCVGLRGGDEGLEINGMTDVTVRDCLLADALNDNVLLTNFAVPSNPERQITRLENVQTRNTSRPNASQGFVFGAAGGQPFGTIKVRNCSYLNTTADALTLTGQVLYATSVPFDRFEVEGFSAVYTAAAPTTTGTVNALLARIAATTTGGYIGIRDMRVKVTSTKTGAGTYFVTAVAAGGASTTEINVDGLIVDLENTLSAGTLVGTALNLGGSFPWTGHGSVRRNNPIYNGVSASTANNAIQVGASWTPSGVLAISDCDFSGLNATAIEIPPPAAAIIPNIQTNAIRWRVYPKPSAAMSAATFAAATFTTATGNQYLGLYPALVQFANGTGAGITTIDVSKDGVTYDNVWTQASGAMAQTVITRVDTGDYVRVTFATTQPTTRVLPIK